VDRISDKLQSTKVVMYAVGDMMFGDSTIKIGHGVRSTWERINYNGMFNDQIGERCSKVVERDKAMVLIQNHYTV